jgi:hypothetical protein
MYYDDKCDMLYVSNYRHMCMFNILYEVDLQPDLYCMISYLII